MCMCQLSYKCVRKFQCKIKPLPKGKVLLLVNFQLQKNEN